MGVTWSACRCGRRGGKAAVAEAPAARLSPFGRFRSRCLDDDIDLGQPRSLLDISVAAVCEGLGALPPGALARLPTDLSQLVLDRLVATERLDGATITALAGQQFYGFDLTAYSHAPVEEGWLRVLCTCSLEAATLSKTPVTDQCLAAFLGLPRLQRLHLEHCVELTDAGMAALQGLASLTELSLAGCPALTDLGVAWLAGMTGLRRLNLEMCNQAAGLGALMGMRELRVLNLGWCGAVDDADMVAVGQLAQLQDLQISYTQVTDEGLRRLHSLTRLTSLGLGGLALSDAGAEALLRLLPALRVLCLERCGRVGDGALRALTETAPGMEDLTLAYSGVTDAGVELLGALRRLRCLSLDKCDRVGDRGALVVSQLTALERLDLTETSVTNATLRALRHLPSLERLNLSFTGANDWGLQHLSRLSTLRRLSLDSDPTWHRFTDAGLEYLAALTGLEVLDLFAARISDAGCRHLSKLSRLHSLEICSGFVTDAGAAALAAGLRGLRHLSLAHNRRVSSASLPALAALTQLTALNLSETGVSGGLVVLSSLTALDTLALKGTKVRPAAVDRLRTLLPRLRTQ